MSRKTVFLLLMLISYLFASKCEPGFTEEVNIQVLDGKLRPIEGALVQIIYQLDSTTHKGYATTNPKITDSNGTVFFRFTNLEILPERVDCEYRIIVNYDNKKVEKTVRVDAHGPVVRVNVPAFRVFIKLKDQYDRPLVGATVVARDFKQNVSNTGSAFFVLGSGPAEINIKYGDGTIVKEIYVSDDLELDYQVSVYNMTVYVVDHKNRPLEALVTIGNQSKYTNTNGTAVFEKIITSRPYGEVKYKSLIKNLDADLEIKREYYVIYDLEAPQFLHPQVTFRNNQDEIILSFDARDSGLRASGIGRDGIKVYYLVSGNKYNAVVYPLGRDHYEAIMKTEPGIYEVTVELKDEEGNIRSVKGYFSVVENKPNENYKENYSIEENYTGEDGRINETNSEEQANNEGFKIEAIHIIGLGLLLILVMIVVDKIRSNLE